MKKVIFILVLALMIVSVGAIAEGDPSAAVPSVTLDQITRVDGSDLPDGFTIGKLPESEHNEQVESLYQSVAAALESNVKLSEVFANPQGYDSVQLPENIDNMMVSEFIPLVVKGAAPEIGDVEVLLTVPGEYSPEDNVQSLIGVIVNGEIIWIPLATEVVGDQIKVVFSSEALQHLSADSEAVLVLLRDIK